MKWPTDQNSPQFILKEEDVIPPVGMPFPKLVGRKTYVVSAVRSALCPCVTMSLMTRQRSYLSDYRMAVSQEGD